ncbi:MAG: dienelactone hydrolase family protein [Geminicoccaceae bacterium]
MDQRLIALYDDYTHARIDRRIFLDGLTKIAGTTAAGLALVQTIAADPAAAALVPADDPDLDTSEVTYGYEDKQIRAYRAAPKDASGPLPGIVVIHENRGLNAHIEDVARRAAKAGFVALAPDVLSLSGGTPKDEDQAREMIGKLDAKQAVGALATAVTWLSEQPGVNGKVGVVGFCWGGGMAGQVAAADPKGLGGAVVFYGRTVEPEKVPSIKVPLLLNYAGLDERINAGIPEFQAALDKAGVRYDLFVYEKVNHAFHNDTSEARYDKAAAELAWNRTIDFFKESLTA